MDFDIIAEVDPLTGLPRVDDRPRARRWLESLHYGPDNTTKKQHDYYYYDNDQPY
jgi:hypothetical protein